MSTDVTLVFVTFPDAETAVRIGRVLVEERLIACISILPGVTSIYTWRGSVESAVEVQALMKTTADVVDRLVARVKQLHPYEVPEVLAVPVTTGLPAYLRWVVEQTVESVVTER